MDFKEWPYLLHLRSICGCWTICKTIHLSVINAHLAQNAVPKRPYRCRIAAVSLPYPRPYPHHIQDMGAHILDMETPISRICISSHILFDILDMGEDMGRLHTQDMQYFPTPLTRTKSW